ncbi:MAG: sialate O-acetylesterase [Bacteroidales bacterium]|nr:sialate O-acetylesterase [Bacteroidales bacterium]
MKKIKSILLASLLFLSGILIQFHADAAIKLPALIGNNMVLQQNSVIKVWGWADAGEKVTVQVSWLTVKSSAITTAKGDWQTTIQTPVAGGPYTISISGRDYTITIENVLIGEVWVCSGQSNMEFTMRGLGCWDNYNPENRNDVSKGLYTNVHLFTVQKDTSDVPLSNCRGNWQIADTNTVNDFSATAWFYGSYLSKHLGIPVGLISSAWGGTPAEVWTPVESIKAEPDLGFYFNHWNGSEWWPGTPGVLFNAMIHPLLNYTIKGAIWYQGESNVKDSKLYPALMNTLITSWRKAWNIGDFPFYFVQIAPFTYENPYSGALLREAQLKCLSISNTGMAVTMDVAGDVTDIHPKNKLEVGKRLALWAMNNTYGKTDVSFSGPVYSKLKISGNCILLDFNYTDGGLKFHKSAVNNFTIAGADHVFYPATLKIEGNTLVVSSSKVKRPQAVRYAFSNASVATLFNGAGLPAPSFRTDNWDIISENAILKPFFDPETKTLTYQLTSKARESDIYYAFNKFPTKKSQRFLLPIPSGKPEIIYAIVSRNGFMAETAGSWKIINNKAIGADITYKNPFSERFVAGGKLALLDGILASENFQDGSWQGFEGNDLDVIIDLGKTIHVKRIKVNFLSDTKSWIFLPKQVSVQVSEDGITYKKLGDNKFSSEKEIEDVLIQPVLFATDCKVRFIKLSAINQGLCPAWHPGAGNKSWIFADEIIVE